MLPKTMAWTLTAVPQSPGILFSLPVGDGPLVVPGAEHGVDGVLELLLGILREVLAGLVLDHPLEQLDQLLQILGGQLGVQLHFLACFWASISRSKTGFSIPRTTSLNIWMKRR